MGSRDGHTATGYTAIPLGGLVAKEPLPFPLYLHTADSAWVLYQAAGSQLDDSHLGRLMAEGIDTLYVRAQDRLAYYARIESALDDVLRDRHVPLPQRAEVLYGVANRVADDLLADLPDRLVILRAQKVMMSTSGLLLRDNDAFRALRSVMAGSPQLARHSLSVAFLSMGLWRLVSGADPTCLAQAGMAGLMHDIGRIGFEGVADDDEHAARGAERLQHLGMPEGVVEVARWHHGRHGAGRIPELARIVGVVDVFDRIHSTREPRVGVFETLRLMAEVHRGRFEPRLGQGLVKLFR